VGVGVSVGVAVGCTLGGLVQAVSMCCTCVSV